MSDPLSDALVPAAATLGLACPPALLEALSRHQALVAKWQGRVRLVGDASPAVMAVRHYLDSLTVLRVVPEGPQRLLDLGAGAGFPTLPLALARADLGGSLVEADRRKASFLNAAIAELGLTGRFTATRLKAAGDPAGEGVPLATVVLSRAFMAPAPWVRLGAPYLAPGGRLIAMLGSDVPPPETLARLGEEAGLSTPTVDRFELPGEAGPRALVVWRRPIEL